MPAHLITLLPCVACTSFCASGEPSSPWPLRRRFASRHHFPLSSPTPQCHACTPPSAERGVGFPAPPPKDTPGWTPWYRSKTSSMRGSFSGW